MSVVKTEKIENVALIALNNPPVNAMSTPLREHLIAAIEELDKDTDVEAIGLYGEGAGFCAGADITEFGKPMRSPLPPDVMASIEGSETPIVAVLHGAALGGGFEMGLASKARVAAPKAKMGLPEVGIGLIPGAGGCVRSARLIGWDGAFNLVTSGKPMSSQEALELGLVDRVAEGAPRDLALEAAKDVAAGTLEARKTTDLPLKEDPAVVDAWLEKMRSAKPRLDAPIAAAEAVAGATLPLDEALANEQRLFVQCLEGPQSAAFIHAFFAERAVWKIPEAKAEPRSIDTIGVIGGGTMGSGIATASLLAGMGVTLVEQNAEAGERAKSVIAKNLAGAVKRGKISEEKSNALINDRLQLATDVSELTTQDVIIEAVFEDMGVKREIFSKLDKAAKPGAILASNTSCLDLDEIASVTSRPQDVLGLHFFSPAHVMRLLEVVVGEKTAPEVTATGFDLAKKLRKIGVRAGVCYGFIGNRILNFYLESTDKLLLEGASPEQVDQAMVEFGLAMGPFAVNDLAGIDISLATRHIGEDGETRALEKKMADAGWLGRKTGKGYYAYEGRNSSPNPDLPGMLEDVRREYGKTPRDFSAEEISDRIVTAMICESVRVLEDGIALRPVDIDAVYLFGYGFPRFRGGPMHYADTIGAAALVERVEAYAKDDPDYWRVPDLLRRMASENKSFASMNG
ncbi:MAG: 3-hydroxyacyl-CoA dehydrogenase NAD-binding domain-containing protein [Pseudomonadota bacterium]